MNREELTECHRGGEKVTEEDQIGAMGLEYVNIDEHRKKHAELVARAWQMYDERRPLFTREMIVDAQRQIDDLNAGRFADGADVSVIGMDGRRYNNMPIHFGREHYRRAAMSFNHIQSMTDLTRPHMFYYAKGVTPVQITCSSQGAPIDNTAFVTSTQVAALLDSCMDSVSRTETWRMLEAVLGRPDIKRLGIDKVVAFGLGDLTSEAVPGGEWRNACMQHAFLLRIGHLLQEVMGQSVRCVAQDPAYLDTCKEALHARGVDIAEPETGFLLVDERTLVFTVSCNAPVRQIVTELAHPAAMIWGCVGTEEVLRGWTSDEERTGILDPSSPYTTDAPSSRVLDMVKGYDEYLLPEEDAACLWGCALYIRKETTKKSLSEPSWGTAA